MVVQIYNPCAQKVEAGDLQFKDWLGYTVRLSQKTAERKERGKEGGLVMMLSAHAAGGGDTKVMRRFPSPLSTSLE